MDKMKKNLNECQAKHITPYWRNHLSMKGKFDFHPNGFFSGWCTMNYPTVLQNPLVRKRERMIEASYRPKPEMKEEPEQEQSYTDNLPMFSNFSRPKTGYKHTDNFRRPLSTKDGGEQVMGIRRTCWRTLSSASLVFMPVWTKKPGSMKKK